MGDYLVDVKKPLEPVTVDRIREVHRERREEISGRLAEFREIREKGSDARHWEEMVFCFFTGG